MTHNWPEIRRLVLFWLFVMAGIAVYFAFNVVTCDIASCSNRTMTGMNLLGLTAILVSSVATGFMLMRANAQLLFTPLIAYAVSCGLFFGFGPMSNFLASEATTRYQASTVYAISAQEVLRTNFLTSLGIAISVGVILLVLPKQTRHLPEVRKISAGSIAVLFVATGLVLKHLLIMPSVYGTSQIEIPGILLNLRYLPDLGFAVMAMIAASGNRRWALLFWLIWPLHFLLAFPEFSKKSVMLTMLLPAIGAYVGHRSVPRLTAWVVSALILFTYLQSTNTIARHVENQAAREEIVLDAGERLEVLRDAAFNDDAIETYIPVSKQGVETWWLRTNYSGPQNAAMELRDSGLESGFTQNILVYIVPRFLWPDKPAIVSPGQRFHGIVTQNPATATKVGITVFADGYWQYGWFGLALWSAIMGLILGVITRMTMTQLGQKLYLYLPAASLGIQLGATSPTAFLQNAFLSGLPVYFGYCLVVSIVYSQFRQWRTKSDVSSPSFAPA